MFFIRWIWSSAAIFAMLTIYSTFLSIQEITRVSPSIRQYKYFNWKYLNKFFWGMVIFRLISVALGFLTAGMWEMVDSLLSLWAAFLR